MRLLESFVDFKLGRLLASTGPMSAKDIVRKLGLHPIRGRKWLHSLSLVGLLEKLPAGDKGEDDVYTLSPLARTIFGNATSEKFYDDHVQYQRNVIILDFNSVLEGMPLPEAVRWPPRTREAAEHLEWWMSETASSAIQAIEKAVHLDQVNKLLDVGGGDGTVACTFVGSHPNLHVTVFNLPNSAFLARNKIAQKGLNNGVAVWEGNFLEEKPLPSGFDLVLWCRVLADWPPEVVRKLLKKTFDAVVPGGQVVICEPLLDDNKDLGISWEFRYIFYDDFGVGVYKSRSAYEQMLTEAGFQLVSVASANETTIHSVIIARRP